ncbi:unnamed protein product, partial [Ectocarpus sp. 12 AP-2014]
MPTDATGPYRLLGLGAFGGRVSADRVQQWLWNITPYILSLEGCSQTLSGKLESSGVGTTVQLIPRCCGKFRVVRSSSSKGRFCASTSHLPHSLTVLLEVTCTLCRAVATRQSLFLVWSRCVRSVKCRLCALS